MYVFAEVKAKVAVTFVAVASPTLQTRAPLRKVLGPSVVGLLLSRPRMFQVIGGGGLVPSGGATLAEGAGMVLIVSTGAAWAADDTASTTHTASRTRTRRRPPPTASFRCGQACLLVDMAGVDSKLGASPQGRSITTPAGGTVASRRPSDKLRHQEACRCVGIRLRVAGGAGLLDCPGPTQLVATDRRAVRGPPLGADAARGAIGMSPPSASSSAASGQTSPEAQNAAASAPASNRLVASLVATTPCGGRPRRSPASRPTLAGFATCDRFRESSRDAIGVRPGSSGAYRGGCDLGRTPLISLALRLLGANGICGRIYAPEC